MALPPLTPDEKSVLIEKLHLKLRGMGIEGAYSETPVFNLIDSTIDMIKEHLAGAGNYPDIDFSLRAYEKFSRPSLVKLPTFIDFFNEGFENKSLQRLPTAKMMESDKTILRHSTPHGDQITATREEIHRAITAVLDREAFTWLCESRGIKKNKDIVRI